MNGFSGSPRVAKGALIGLDPLNPLASVVVFQYNPESMSRSIRANISQDRGGGSEPLRLKGPPSETISVDIEVDAVDQLEVGDPVTEQSGIAPALASLELMLYPKSRHGIIDPALVWHFRQMMLDFVLEHLQPDRGERQGSRAPNANREERTEVSSLVDLSADAGRRRRGLFLQ